MPHPTGLLVRGSTNYFEAVLRIAGGLRRLFALVAPAGMFGFLVALDVLAASSGFTLGVPFHLCAVGKQASYDHRRLPSLSINWHC